MTHFKLPAPELSYLKEVDIDLDMTGRHYVKISTSEGQLAEQVIMDVLSDLIKQDAYDLTMEEMRYLFMMVKINSLENDFSVTITCTHKKADGTPCGHTQTEKIKLSDADLKRTPKGYKVPVIKFVGFDGVEKEYEVRPPKIKDEIELMTWFMNDLGKTHEEIAKDKDTAFHYTFVRGLLHLQRNGEPLIKETNEFPDALSLLDKNHYSTVGKLYKAMEEVNSFGIAKKVNECKCKECGGTLVFAPPLLYGLVD